MKMHVAKNRVQPANSPQGKCFVSRARMESELVAVPDFSLPPDFCYGLAGDFRHLAAAWQASGAAMGVFCLMVKSSEP